MFVIKNQKLVAIVLLASLLVSLISMGTIQAKVELKQPSLFITEIVPDSTNVEGNDAYEFIEIYNQSEEAINFNHYELRYRHGSTDTLWSPPVENYEEVIIPAQSSVVFWITNTAIYDNANVTIEMFNQNYGTALVDGIDIFKVKTSGGMSNSAARTFSIVDPNSVNEHGEKQIISQSTYDNDDQTKPDKGIFYRIPNLGSIDTTMMDYPGTIAATPGIVDIEQLIPQEDIIVEDDETVSSEPLAVTLTSTSTQIVPLKDYTITATLEFAEQDAAAVLFYAYDEDDQFTAIPMEIDGTNLSKTIEQTELMAYSTITYYIEAIDHREVVAATPIHTVNIVHIDDNDFIDAPALIVTELLPNSSNVNAGDAYEFIEVYNNTNQPINFKDYKLFYIYTDSGRIADIEWPSIVEDFVIEPMDTMVFWIINSYNKHLTVDDFNHEFNTSLIENVNIVKVYSDGMANSSRRGVAVGTNTHQDISVALYDGTKSNVANKGSHYQYQIGQTELFEYAVGTIEASPGYVMPEQVPAKPINVPSDEEEPIFINRTEINEVNESDNISLRAQITDDLGVKTVKLYYKTDKDSTYTVRSLYDENRTNLFSYTVNSTELIGRDTLSYYYQYSDGPHTLVSSEYNITIGSNRNDEAIRLNVNDQQIVSGVTLLKAAGEELAAKDISLRINSEQVTNTFNAIESNAYFVFEATDVDYYFKNGVTIGEEIIYTFLDPLKTYTSITVPIEAERLQAGSNKIAIRAGTKSGPFDDRQEENKDDFRIRNIRLILEDGTNIYDASYADKASEFKMGDSAGKFEFIEFDFQLTEEDLRALAFAWDTTTIEDGEQEINVEAGNLSLATKVIVDNTAPVIKPSINEGEALRGEFTIDAEVTDVYAGVKSVTALLNEQPITLPYETSTGKLDTGDYEVIITAIDHAGNKSEQKVKFSIENDNPTVIEAISPSNGEQSVSVKPKLTVHVEDPQGDAMTVEIKRGFHYDALRSEGFTAYRGASSIEPPKQKVPSNEEGLTDQALQQISTFDGEYFTTNETEAFPYHRFDIKLDSSVKETDKVQIKWYGKSLEGRKVSLYVWNPKAEKWDLMVYKVAGNNDFVLATETEAGMYNDNGMIHVLVQDEMPVSQEPYDFTFVWMSDTQYYSESYPEIYLKNTEWIVENKDELDIRYIIHTGDIVDEADQSYQWENADQAMKKIEQANIPYGVLAGNHDVDHQTGDYNTYWQHFGEERFVNNGVFAGSYQNNRGHYDLVSAGGVDFIIVYMGWNIGDEEIEWMNQVVKAHPDRKAILALHEYLLVSNNRAPIGDEIFERVVIPNPNVFATVSGHYHDAETLIDEIDDDGDGIADRKVYQMLADYQGAEMGGLGYIRFMHFNLEHNKIYMKTYSPYLDDYNYYDPEIYPNKDEFEIDTDLGVMNKQVATDYFEVNIFTEDVIGKATNIESGKTATISWDKLKPNTRYEWFVEATDQYSGHTISPIWNFTTGASQSSTPSTPNESPAPSNTPEVTPPANNTNKIEQVELKIADVNSGTMNVVASHSTTTLEVRLASDVVKAIIEADQSLELELGGQLVVFTYEELKAMQAQNTTVITLTVTPTNVAANYKHASPAITVQVQPSKLDATSTEVQLFMNIGKIDPELATVYELVDGQWTYVESTMVDRYLAIDAQVGAAYMIAQFTHQFNDIESHWAKRSIDILASKHIVNGVSAERYAPSEAVTRADYTTMLIRALGILHPQVESSSFADVHTNAYYAAFVAQAKQLDIVRGNDNSFRPLDQISREEAIVMLMRAYLYVHPNAEIMAKTSNIFTDNDQISPWATEAVSAASALGFITGSPEGKLNPKSTLTRAELAVMIVNFLSTVK